MRRSVTGLMLTLALSLLMGALAANAQPPKTVRIGYLSALSPSDTEDAFHAFRTKLRALGYIEGQNLLIEARYAESRYERLPQLAADLVWLQVDVILVHSTPASLAAKQATS